VNEIPEQLIELKCKHSSKMGVKGWGYKDVEKLFGASSNSK
jgi:hypothetical protein